MIHVVDASVIIDVLMGSSSAAHIEKIIFGPSAELCAPELLRLEVHQVLRRWVLAKSVTLARAEAALDDFAAMRVSYRSAEPLLARCWQLRNNLTIYDATYLALAEHVGGRLATRDHAFAQVSSPAIVDIF